MARNLNWFQNALLRIPQSPQPPQYVFWQKNERMINYDDSRRDITIETSPGPRTQSRLIIREPQIADSGNYTCSASNTEPASIYVFVSKGNEGRLIHTASSSGLYPSTPDDMRSAKFIIFFLINAWQPIYLLIAISLVRFMVAEKDNRRKQWAYEIGTTSAF